MSITDFLSHDHRACDQLFAEAEAAASRRDWATAQKVTRRFLDAMDHHFRMEEEVLFPRFEEATGMHGGPPQMMRFEHQQMRGLFEDLAQAVAKGDDAAYLGTSETLLVMMQQHNMKEENILYPMCDNALGSSDVGGTIAQRLAAA